MEEAKHPLGDPNEFITKNNGLVWFVVNKYKVWWKGFGYEMEDIHAIALLGLFKAYLTYVEDKGRISTYATICMINEIRHFLRGMKHYPKTFYSFDTDGEDSPKEALVNPSFLISPVEESTFELRDYIARLPVNDRKVLHAYHLGGNQEGAARILKMSQVSVSRKMRRIRKEYHMT